MTSRIVLTKLGKNVPEPIENPHDDRCDGKRRLDVFRCHRNTVKIGDGTRKIERNCGVADRRLNEERKVGSL